jgi:digeranylgeranylglycerophospholipid reductase
MKKIDVAIVGGGPVGGYIAYLIAQKGYSTCIIEEHQTIGLPLKCAGLITPRVFDNIPISKEKLIENTIKGAHIHMPSGEILTIGGNKNHALVINRTIFDQKLIKKAQESGAVLKQHSKVIDLKKEKNKISISIKNNNTITKTDSSIVIGADGPYSILRRRFNFPEPKEFLIGMGAQVENINLDPNFVEIFLGRNIAPGFFAWAIPTNKQGTQARIGLCVEKSSILSIKHCFQNLIKQPVLNETKILKYSGGVIPLGPLKKTTSDHILLVGDAAAQVKPTSGGGIYPGLVCAKKCSDVVLEALQSHEFNNKNLINYHQSWTQEIGKELSLGMSFRRIFYKLDDKQINNYLTKLNQPKNIDILNRYGDIDYPSKLIFPLLKKNPSFVKLFPKLLKKNKI